MGDPMSDKSIRCRILGGEKKTIMTPPLRKKQRRTPDIYNYISYYILQSIYYILYYIYIFYIILYMGMQGVDYFPQPGTSLTSF